MITTTLSAFRKDMKSYLDRVMKRSETLISHRKKHPSVVLLSLDEYNALMTTAHEMSSRINRQRLDASIASLKGREQDEKDTGLY
jgi:antitoxin YefM